MPHSGHRFVPRLTQGRGCELPDRFKHPIARLPVRVRALTHEALVDQRTDPVEDIASEVITPANRFGSFKAAAPHEETEDVEQTSLRRRKQVIAPLDRRPQTSADARRHRVRPG